MKNYWLDKKKKEYINAENWHDAIRVTHVCGLSICSEAFSLSLDLSQLNEGIMTRAEVRAALNLPTIEGN